MQQQIKLISKQQIMLIKSIQTHHQQDDEYRLMLWSMFHVKSCTQLTYIQAEQIISRYRRFGWFVPKAQPAKRKKKSAQPQKNVIRMISLAQRKKISALRELITWFTPRGYTAWIVKMFGIQKPVTSDDALKIIEGLKKMFERQMKKTYGTGWMLLYHAEPEIRRYIAEHGRK